MEIYNNFSLIRIIYTQGLRGTALPPSKMAKRRNATLEGVRRKKHTIEINDIHKYEIMERKNVISTK